jgi:mannose-1-phosphate guanylyltransferase
MSSLHHVIVLAGGEGQRLAPLTRALYGTALPKQFAVLAGERSLMQTTIERALILTVATRISVVVTAHHADIAREQLAPYPASSWSSSRATSIPARGCCSRSFAYWPAIPRRA